MKLVFYNALAANTTDKLEEISGALREWNAVALTGTHQWAGPEPMKKTNHRYHVALQFGAKKETCIPKARGATLLMSNEM
eukprot:3232103-Pyramimonas_sp.AAC.1